MTVLPVDVQLCRQQKHRGCVVDMYRETASRACQLGRADLGSLAWDAGADDAQATRHDPTQDEDRRCRAQGGKSGSVEGRRIGFFSGWRWRMRWSERRTRPRPELGRSPHDGDGLTYERMRGSGAAGAVPVVVAVIPFAGWRPRNLRPDAGRLTPDDNHYSALPPSLPPSPSLHSPVITSCLRHPHLTLPPPQQARPNLSPAYLLPSPSTPPPPTLYRLPATPHSHYLSLRHPLGVSTTAREQATPLNPSTVFLAFTFAPR